MVRRGKNNNVLSQIDSPVRLKVCGSFKRLLDMTRMQNAAAAPALCLPIPQEAEAAVVRRQAYYKAADGLWKLRSRAAELNAATSSPRATTTPCVEALTETRGTHASALSAASQRSCALRAQHEEAVLQPVLSTYLPRLGTVSAFARCRSSSSDAASLMAALRAGWAPVASSFRDNIRNEPAEARRRRVQEAATQPLRCHGGDRRLLLRSAAAAAAAATPEPSTPPPPLPLPQLRAASKATETVGLAVTAAAATDDTGDSRRRLRTPCESDEELELCEADRRAGDLYAGFAAHVKTLVEATPAEAALSATSPSADPAEGTGATLLSVRADGGRRASVPTYGEWGLAYGAADLRPLLARRVGDERRAAKEARALRRAGKCVRRVRAVAEALDDFQQQHRLGLGDGVVGGGAVRQLLMRGGMSLAAKGLQRQRTCILNRYRSTEYAKLWKDVPASGIRELYELHAGGVQYCLTRTIFACIHERWADAMRQITEAHPLVLDEIFAAIDSSKDGRASFTEFLAAVSILVSPPSVQILLCALYQKLGVDGTAYTPLTYEELCSRVLGHVGKRAAVQARWKRVLADVAKLSAEHRQPGAWSLDTLRVILFMDEKTTSQERFQGLTIT